MTMTSQGASSKGPIRVLFCCNPAFYQHLAVALISMLEHNPHAEFEVYLITSAPDARLEAKLRRSIEIYRSVVLTIRHFSLESYAHFFVSSHITLESYLRILAADVLGDEIGKILYLDCDLVILADLKDLWETDIDANSLAAAPDLYGEFRREALGMPAASPYVNAGVLLLNLARWRREKISERLIRFIETHGELAFHDQDAINAVLHDSILLLNRRWNVQAQMYRAKRRVVGDAYEAIRTACRDPAILHYAGPEKPWRFRVSVAKRRCYFRYLRKAAWRGRRPEGMAWYHLPEYWMGRILDGVGVDYMRGIVLVRKCCRRAVSRIARLGRTPVIRPAGPSLLDRIGIGR